MIAKTSSMKRQLMIMRHAKSSWADPGMADFDRPLNDRGRAAAKRMGKLLRSEDLDVDVILGSTACRVRETLDLMIPAWGTSAPHFLSKELYLASRETLLRQIRAVDGSLMRIMLVAHNPGLAELVGWFTHTEVHFPTAALALFESESPANASWSQALSEDDWKLVNLWKPKELAD